MKLKKTTPTLYLCFFGISKLIFKRYANLSFSCVQGCNNFALELRRTQLHDCRLQESSFRPSFVCLFFRDGWGEGYAFERAVRFCLWFVFIRFVPSDEFCFYYWAQLRQCLIQKKLLRSRNPHRKIFSDRLIGFVGKSAFFFSFCFKFCPENTSDFREAHFSLIIFRAVN